MSREFRNLVATLLLTMAAFLVIREIVVHEGIVSDWPLPLALAVIGLVLAAWPERAAAQTSLVPVDGAASMPVAVGDDLTLIKGIGPQRAQTLAQAGCPRFSDLARLSDSELARLLEEVGAVPPSAAALRSWIRQAQIADGGDMAWLRSYQATLNPAGEEPDQPSPYPGSQNL